MARRISLPRISLPPLLAAPALFALLVAACQPTVRVEAPEKPIVINVNVKIEHEVRVRVEKDIEDLLSSEPELF
ncbi:YnbE family lipoprotein [Tistrella bauzanensis]|uniref:YnbE family lipoprotein n=1 Tax=Tistrella arctica TaxID=3133430 RepID=A0ABU9YTD9_9PROT